MLRVWCFAVLAVSVAQSQAPDLPPGVEFVPDLTYASRGGHNLQLDLFSPMSGKGPFPAVIYLHGGGWNSGSRRQFYRYAAQMATIGFVGVTIEYRLSAEAKYPAAIEDSRAAVRWVRAHAGKYRIDPQRIGAAGQSAGGHLAALLGVGANPAEEVRAVAAFNPPTDLPSLTQGEAGAAVTAFLGTTYSAGAEIWREASPLTHVSGRSAPMLFLHGTADTTVPYRQSVVMCSALQAAGVPCEMYSAEGKRHLWFFNSEADFQATLLRMEDFFRRYLE